MIPTAEQCIAEHLLSNDVALLRRLGNRRAALLRELHQIDRDIIQTSERIGVTHNAMYASSPQWGQVCYTAIGANTQ